MYCSECGLMYTGGTAPGIGKVCECGHDDFISFDTYKKLEVVKWYADILDTESYIWYGNKDNFDLWVCRWAEYCNIYHNAKRELIKIFESIPWI